MDNKAGRFARNSSIIGGIAGAALTAIGTATSPAVKQIVQEKSAEAGIKPGTLAGFSVVFAGVVYGAAGAVIGGITGLFFKKGDKERAAEADTQALAATLQAQPQQSAMEVGREASESSQKFRDNENARRSASVDLVSR